MVESAYEWVGPFKYTKNGTGFYYKNKFYMCEKYRTKPISGYVNESVYYDDELFARFLRRDLGVTLYDELPEGWHRGINEYGGRRGLRGRYDDSTWEWCETDVPMYRNEYEGDWHRNKEYRQALVRRATH